MNKKDIMALLEYKRNLRASKKFDELRDRYGGSSRFDILNYELPENELPEIPELKEKLLILKKELEDIKEIKRNNIRYIQENKEIVENIDCYHPIVFYYGAGLSRGCYCALCDKILNNKVTTGIVELEADFSDEDGYFYRRYNFNDVYDIIIDILKDKDDKENIYFGLEFLEQFEQLNLGEVKIRGVCYKKEYNVLVIGGSNKIMINDSISFVNNKINNVNEIIKYLRYIYRINLMVVGSEGLVDDRVISKGHKKEYNSISDLNNCLDELKDIDYDLIIDLTNLYDYKIVDNKIDIFNVLLNLEELFPNSRILKLSKSQTEEEFYNLLKDLLEEENRFSNDFKRLILKR